MKAIKKPRDTGKAAKKPKRPNPCSPRRVKGNPFKGKNSAQRARLMSAFSKSHKSPTGIFA